MCLLFCFVLFYFGYYVVLCVKKINKKLLITKKRIVKLIMALAFPFIFSLSIYFIVFTCEKLFFFLQSGARHFYGMADRNPYYLILYLI